jgi:tetratricopeptide (TPR) repeat protein
MHRAITCALAFVIACHHAPPPVSVGPLPPGAYSHYLAGKMALYRDDLDDAVREMSAAVEAAPDQPMISVELARMLAKAKRDDGAQDVLARARKKWPYHAQVWLASGEVLEIGAEKTPALRKEALQAYKRAVALEPTEERGYLGLARTQEAVGDKAGAEKTLRALVAKKPDSVDGHYRLAERLEEKGERDAAAKELRAVLEWEPDHLDARMDLARTLRRQGKLSESVEQARSAFDRAGQPMDLAEELYWLICEADDLQGAVDLLTLLDDDRSDADALATVAQFHRGLGRVAESRVVAEHIKPLDADESVIALAEADITEGNTKAAIDRLQAIGASSARYIESRRVLVNAYLAAHDTAKALEVIAPLRVEKPDQLDLEFAEALTRAEAGDAAAATKLAASFKGADKAETIGVAYLHARVLDKLGDWKGALAVLEPALAKTGDHVGALNLAGYLLAQHGERLADAERYLSRARDLSPGDPSVLDSWGYLLLKRGKTREAVRALDHAARFSPREPEILVHLAEAWAADGAPKHAAEVLDRAQALKPPPDVARRIDAIRAKLAIR